MIRVPDAARPVLCDSTSRGGPETARAVVVGGNDVGVEFDTVVVLETRVVDEASVVSAPCGTVLLGKSAVSLGFVVSTLACSDIVVVVTNDVSAAGLSVVLLDC